MPLNDINALGLEFDRFNVRPMRFRSRHVADSVVDRIMEVSDAISQGKPIKEPKEIAVSIDRGDNGELIVQKTLSDGTLEIMTIQAPTPAGQIDDIPADAAPATEQDFIGVEPGGIVEGAALGGDSLDTLLRT